MHFVFDWLDQRTGWRGMLRGALYESVPGGARWRYVWGSTLTFALMVQVITGVFLWIGYSAGSQSAWESVYYIQDQMRGGWFLRGLHHYTAQVMTVLLILHLMQVVIDGAYKAPREVNFWFGLILLQLVLALSLTGYLLPWDQKGFWASKVAINLLGTVPWVGASLQRLVIGGPEYGHHTLTRFFALHAGILPGTVTALVIGHVYLFRRHGLTAKEPKRRPDTLFWPDQVLKDAVACLAVLAVVVFLMVRHRLFGGHGPLGAELGPPADPSEPYSAARPEWYFLCFFQFLKFFRGNNEVWGAIFIPGLLMGVVFLMPWLGRWKLGHRFNIGFLLCMLAGAGLLTWQAKVEDRGDQTYQAAVRAADAQSERVRLLAGSPTGIPTSGAVTLLRNDPLTQGPKLFAQKCAGCHRYGGGNGLGEILKEPQSASDLKGFASREWIAGLLNPAKIVTTNYFGATHFADGKMVKFVTREIAGYSADQQEQLRKVIVALSAEAQLKAQETADKQDATVIAQGRELMADAMHCTDCHVFHKPNEDASGPDLNGYGSRAWLVKFIGNPAHADLYGKRNDRMPAFGADQILSEQQIGLIADWLRGSWYEPAQTAQK